MSLRVFRKAECIEKHTAESPKSEVRSPKSEVVGSKRNIVWFQVLFIQNRCTKLRDSGT